MRTAFGWALLGLLVLPPLAAGQTLTPGKYKGTVEFLFSGKPILEMVTLTIDTVEGNQFEGIAWVGIKICRVDTPVRGRLDGDTLIVTGKPLKDNCGIRWELKGDGNKFEGKSSNGNPITLSK